MFAHLVHYLRQFCCNQQLMQCNAVKIKKSSDSKHTALVAGHNQLGLTQCILVGSW